MRSVNYLRKHTKGFTKGSDSIRNLKIVLKIAGRYWYRKDYDDIVSEGIYGLLEAYRDHNKFETTTLLYLYIRRRINMYFAEMKDLYRIPQITFQKRNFKSATVIEYEDISTDKNDISSLDGIIKIEEKEMINVATETLSVKQQNIISLLYVCELPNTEVAKIEKISRQALDVHKKAALKRLRCHFKSLRLK